MLTESDGLVRLTLGISQFILLLMKLQRLYKVVQLVPKLIHLLRVRVMLHLKRVIILDHLLQLVLKAPIVSQICHLKDILPVLEFTLEEVWIIDSSLPHVRRSSLRLRLC